MFNSRDAYEDAFAQAHRDGHDAYIDGKPITECPYRSLDLVAGFEQGWMDAKYLYSEGVE